MPGIQILLRSLRTLAKKRLSLKAMERRPVGEERQFIESMGRMLSGLGYRVVAVNRHDTESRASRPRRRLAPKNLKCPRCGRRFSFTMPRPRTAGASLVTEPPLDLALTHLGFSASC